MNKASGYYRKISREWFINNHPLVQMWEARRIKWAMHHWDPSLKSTNPERYNLWILDDLVPMTDFYHRSMHDKSRSYETLEKINKAKIGRQVTAETRAKISAKNTGHKHTEESKRKMSEARTGKPNRGNYKKVRCVETGVVYESGQAACADTGAKNICRAIKNGTKAGGYHWEYVI